MDEEVSEKIKKIEERLDSLETMTKTIGASPTKKERATMSDISVLSALPSNLQKTLLAVQELGEATTSRVAEQTKRHRSTENINLNQLAMLGFLSKERKKHEIYFKVLEKKGRAIRRSVCD